MTAGAFLTNRHITNPSIFPLALGAHQANIWRYTVDYFPLIPWFGVTPLGILIGNLLYCGGKRKFRMPDFSIYKPAKIFSWAGRFTVTIKLM